MATPYPIVEGVRFKGVAGWPNYCAGDDGSIWSRRRANMKADYAYNNGWRKLAAHIGTGGYVYVMLCNRGHCPTVRAHKIILETFVGPCPPGMVCCHGDGDRTNNALSNLRWGTHVENMEDQRRHGTLHCGEDHEFAVLAEADIVEIRRLASMGWTQLELSAAFNVTRRNINHIVNRRTWKHVG